MAGDPAPGVPGATFVTFPSAITSFNVPALCDSFGHAAFYATTSTGVGGIWSDMTGVLAAVVKVGDAIPGVLGPDTVTALGTFLMSDHG